jgi:hypothetical protein
VNRPPPQQLQGRSGQALYDGAAGIALAHIEYANTGIAGWHTAHQWVTAMLRSPITAHPDTCGLDLGAPAVAFTLHAADRPSYAPTLAILDEHITTATRHRLARAHNRIDAGALPKLREYDLIHGLTGLGAYLMHRHGGGELLLDVLSYLVRLTKPLTIDSEVLPGWWTGNAPGDQPSPRWPGGHGNLGMAHGIAGPLTLLSIAMRSGITVAGHLDAISRICAWLDQWRHGTAAHAWWPEMISTLERRSGTIAQPGPGRPSWCYGTPGLARAQQLAGLALTDPHRQRLAEHALAGCLTDTNQLTQLTDASLCHGWAGVLQTTWRVATDAREPEQFPTPELLRHTDRFLRLHGPPVCRGLLDGVAGVHLARHTGTVGVAPRSGWDACLLLDGGRAGAPDTAQH